MQLLRAYRGSDLRYRICHTIFTLRNYVLYNPTFDRERTRRRDQDFMLNQGGLLHDPNDISAEDTRSPLHFGLKMPFLLSVESRRSHSSLDTRPNQVLNNRERSQNSIIYLSNQAWAKLCRQRFASSLNFLAGFYPRGLLVGLYRRRFAFKADDFSDHSGFSHFHELVHPRTSHSFGKKERTRDTEDCASP